MFKFRRRIHHGLRIRWCRALRLECEILLWPGIGNARVDSADCSIAKPLKKKPLFGFDGGDEVGEPSGGHAELPGMILQSLAQFGRRDHHLPF